jgi:hypothetical protein
MVNCDHLESRRRSIIFSGKVLEEAGCYGRVAASLPFEPVLRSDAMFNSVASNARKPSEPKLAHPGQGADSDDAKQPTPGTPYTPYSEKPALPELPYKPYAEKPAHEALYEPYKDI